jgi:hypothetical protein
MTNHVTMSTRRALSILFVSAVSIVGCAAGDGSEDGAEQDDAEVAEPEVASTEQAATRCNLYRTWTGYHWRNCFDARVTIRVHVRLGPDYNRCVKANDSVFLGAAPGSFVRLGC